MNRISRYIFIQHQIAFLTVLAVLTLLVWLSQSLRFVELITSRGIGFIAFFKLTALLVLQITYFCIPIAVFIATLYLLLKLSSDREHVIFMGIGLSATQIAKPILISSIFITLLNYLNSFILLPISYMEFKELQDSYRNKLVSIFIEEGVFNNQLENRMIYVEKKDGNSLEGVFIYDRQNPSKMLSIIAESGKIEYGAKGPIFTLYDGSYQEEDVKTNKKSLATFDSYRFDSSSQQNVDESRGKDPFEMYIWELFQSTDNEKDNKTNISNAHQRIIWPIQAILLALVAALLMQYGTFSRRFSVRKVLVTSVIASSLVSLIILLSSLVLKGSIYTFLLYATTFATIIILYEALRNDSIPPGLKYFIK